MRINSESYYDVDEVMSNEEAIRRAFDELNRTTIAKFNSKGKLPVLKDTSSSLGRPIPIGGYYGSAFFSSNPSEELISKEKKRAEEREDTSDYVDVLEKGLCMKYGVVPPKKYPNRRGDRGTSGEQILIIGETVNNRRHPKLWGIREEDRTRHSFIIGGSGSGKSTLLHALGVEDMWYWRGGLLMEPHGDLAYNLLHTAPPYRIHDIIYLNVLDPIASPGFNPLELPKDPSESDRQEAIGRVTALIQKHFNMDTGYVRLVRMLTNALTALSYTPGATLLEIMDFYNNEDIRNTVLSFMPDGPLKDSIADTAMNAKADDLASLDNRMSRFNTNRYMKHLFGQSKTTVDFYDLMNKGYYIICPVSKGGTHDDIFLKFYGSYVVSEVYKAAEMRGGGKTEIPEMDRVNFALTLDEFQNFLSDDIEGILAEARKYGLMMMLANQYLGQLTPTIESAVLSNCATKLCYNLGPVDAPIMAKNFGFGTTPNDMMNIPKYHVLAAPLVMGGPVKPFISKVFPPISLKSDLSNIVADLIAETSRNRYMKNRDKIDEEITERKERLASGNKDAVIEMAEKAAQS